jgi:hypothetical protein
VFSPVILYDGVHREEILKNGFAILLILVAVVLIALLYFIDLTAMFGPTENIDYYAERPWFEENRLLAENAFPVKQTGKGGKVVIESKTTLKGSVSRKDETKGRIEITITPDGKAAGTCSCRYEYTDSSYKIEAQFAGNIDPTKIYADETGKNKKLLYFITKGKYKQTKTDKAAKNQWTTEQPVYVVGWIAADYSAKGKMFLMTDSDQETHGNAEYDWQTKPGL